MWRHGFELYEMLVRVPLLIQAPGATPRRIDVPRSAIDLAPTILELTGTPPEPVVPGQEPGARDLRQAPRSRATSSPDLPRTSDNDRRRTLGLHGQYKIIAWGDDYSWELFDVAADPLEEHDLKKSNPALFDEMKARYKDAVKKIHDICPKHTDKLKGKSKSHRC